MINIGQDKTMQHDITNYTTIKWMNTWTYNSTFVINNCVSNCLIKIIYHDQLNFLLIETNTNDPIQMQNNNIVKLPIYPNSS